MWDIEHNFFAMGTETSFKHGNLKTYVDFLANFSRLGVIAMQATMGTNENQQETSRI